MVCNLCPRHCDALRERERGNGFCKMGYYPRVARIARHMWEEPCISGSRGSGAVFFSGCTMRCVYCQNYEISAKGAGEIITPAQLAREISRLENTGAHNINLVSPTPYVEAITEALDICKPTVPVVYNCGGWEDAATLKRLEGYVDIYLPDFKYADNAIALKYSGVNEYAETALTAIGEMLRQTGKPVFDREGLMKKGTLIRHLVLPNHTKNSIEALNILNARLDGFLISLMCQYVPVGRAKTHEKLNRKITQREYEKVKRHLFDLNIDGYVQELAAADTKYIPLWNYGQPQ